MKLALFGSAVAAALVFGTGTASAQPVIVRPGPVVVAPAYPAYPAYPPGVTIGGAFTTRGGLTLGGGYSTGPAVIAGPTYLPVAPSYGYGYYPYGRPYYGSPYGYHHHHHYNNRW